MALLVGRSDIAAFTGTAFFGFGGGVYNTVSYVAAADGTATVLNSNITSFESSTAIRCLIYEQVGGTGAKTAVATIDVVPGAAPQSTTLPAPLTITAGNRYYIAAWNSDGSGFWNSSIDPTVVAPDGTSGLGLSGTFAAPDTTLPATLTREEDGEFYWNLDGTVSGSPTVTPGQSFSIAEDAASGTQVGTVATTGGTPTSFTIAGTDFEIASTGIISVAAGVTLDFETTPQYILGVTVNGSAAVNVTINVTDVVEGRSIDSVTGTIAPDETIVLNTTGLDATPTVQTATLGGQALTVNSWSAITVNVTIPTFINLAWGSTYDLVLTDDTGAVTLASQVLANRAGFEVINYDGTADSADYATEESIKELIETDHTDTIVLNDQVYASTLANVTYNSDTTVDYPAGPDITGTYYYRHNNVVSPEYPLVLRTAGTVVTAGQNFIIGENSPATPAARRLTSGTDPNGPSTASPVLTTGEAPTGFTISGTLFTIDSGGVIRKASFAALPAGPYVVQVTPTGGTPTDVTIHSLPAPVVNTAATFTYNLTDFDNSTDVLVNLNVANLTLVSETSNSLYVTNSTNLYYDGSSTITGSLNTTLTLFNGPSTLLNNITTPLSITVQDNKAPFLNLLVNGSIIADGTTLNFVTGSTVTLSNNATDTNQGGDPSVTIEVLTNDLDVNVPGTYTYQVRATDSSSNATTKTINIVIANPVAVVDPFSFTAVTNAIAGQGYTSNLVTLSVTNGPVSISSFTGGQLRVNGTISAAPLDVDTGDTLQISLGAPTTIGQTATATLILNGTTYLYEVTTTQQLPVVAQPQSLSTAINQPIGTVAGIISWTAGTVSAVTLTGANASDFTVGLDGTVTTNVIFTTASVRAFNVSITDEVGTSNTGTISVNVVDPAALVPVITENQSFNLQENLSNQTVGVLDFQANGTVVNITSSNPEIAIANNGNITVANAQNFESTPQLVSTIIVENTTDTSAPVAITINIADENETQTPIIDSDSFTVIENAPENAAGQVIATIQTQFTTEPLLLTGTWQNHFVLNSNNELIPNDVLAPGTYLLTITATNVVGVHSQQVTKNVTLVVTQAIFASAVTLKLRGPAYIELYDSETFFDPGAEWTNNLGASGIVYTSTTPNPANIINPQVLAYFYTDPITGLEVSATRAIRYLATPTPSAITGLFQIEHFSIKDEL